MSNSFQSCGLKHARLLCPWDSPGKNIGVGCHFLLQGIFLTQGLNPGLPHCRLVLHCWGRGEAPNRISRDCQISSGVKEWTHPWMRTIMWIKRGFYLAQHPPWLLLDPLHTSQRPHVFPSGPFSGVIMTDMVDLAMNSLPLKLHTVSATWFSGPSKVSFFIGKRVQVPQCFEHLTEADFMELLPSLYGFILFRTIRFITICISKKRKDAEVYRSLADSLWSSHKWNQRQTFWYPLEGLLVPL